MKKFLLLFSLTLVLQANSQVFWEPRNTSFTNTRGISDISIADENNIWVQAYDGVTPTNEILEFAKSSDGGETWTNGAIGIPTTSTVASLQAMSDNVCYAGASANGLYKTVDAGATWTNVTVGYFNGATSFFDFGAFVDDNIGVAVGDPLGGYFEIYRTVNGGSTWVRIPSGSIAAMLPDEYAFTNSYYQVGNTIWFLTNLARTYRSNDAGLTWTAYANPLPAGPNTPGGEFCFKSATEGIMFTRDYEYWNTVNGGETWEVLPASGTLRCNQITFVPGTENTYVSIGNDFDGDLRGTSYSVDGGLNWEDINLLGDDLNVDGGSSVSFFSTTLGFASGFSGQPTTGIFKYVGTQFSLASESFSNGVAITASPNPTSGITELVSKNIAQVSVIDILGKVVYNNTFSSLSNVSLDLSNFNTGVYMVKVTNDTNETATLKIVKQ